jgi:diacylglycerol kinase
MGGVFAAEVLNTAMESLARSLGPRRHPRIRDALDMASGGVLLAALTAAVIGVLVLGERAGSLLGWW